MTKIEINLPDELYQRLLSLQVDPQRVCLTALEAAVTGLKMATKLDDTRKAGRPAPPVPKSKRSLYLDEQVWQALEAKQIQGEGISSVANRLLREALMLDEK